jgi:type IV pilus assembly protein PilB
VLSTVHTNDAPSTVSRLLNMGVEPFLVTASLNLVVAQRLARRICPECREPIPERHEEALAAMGMSEEQIATGTVFHGRGCNLCNSTGYRGRIALYECMPFSDALKELVLQGASAAELKAEMIRQGVRSLRMAGLQKILEGVTTPEEVLRTTVDD